MLYSNPNRRTRRLGTITSLHFNISSYNYGAFAGHHSQFIRIFLSDWLNPSFATRLLAGMVGASHATKTSHICK